MSMTPVEIRHLQLKRGLFGYRRASVETVLEEVADSFESVWRERAALGERLEELETELGRHVELENLLRSTLVSAERAAQDLKEQARREADTIVSEANAEARRVLRDAITEKERIAGDSRRIRALLRSALEVMEEEASSSVDEPGEHTALLEVIEETDTGEQTAPEASETTPQASETTGAENESTPAASDEPGFRRLAG